MKNTHINDLLVQGSKWGPTKLSVLKKDKEYSEKQYNAVKTTTPEEIIASCDADGQFFIGGHAGKVLRVYINKTEMDFAEYAKKYDFKPQKPVIVPSVSSAYQFM